MLNHLLAREGRCAGHIFALEDFQPGLRGASYQLSLNDIQALVYVFIPKLRRLKPWIFQ